MVNSLSITSKLAILAGGGRLPELLVNHALEQGLDFILVTFRGQPLPTVTLPQHQHFQCGLGEVGHLLDILKKHNVQNLVLAGRMEKTGLFDLLPDLRGLRFLTSLTTWHDDAIFSGLINLFTQENFTVIAPHQVMPELLMKTGTLTLEGPAQKEMDDITIGLKAARLLGVCDIGQAVIVKDKVIIGVEGVEGTDALIERCAALRGRSAKGGILVKCAKPGQNMLVDMPTVGPRTVELLARYNFKGMAVVAGETMVLDEAIAKREANHHHLFMFGIDPAVS